MRNKLIFLLIVELHVIKREVSVADFIFPVRVVLDTHKLHSMVYAFLEVLSVVCLEIFTPQCVYLHYYI